jgi:hypothetical protein
MKGKVAEFIVMFVGYCIIFLTWNNWNLTGRQIAEMIFIGTLGGLFSALTIKPLTRLIENIVRKMKI